jgi:hypothetical protein
VSDGSDRRSVGSGSVRAARFGPAVAGLLALAVGTAFGWDARLLDALVMPPTIMRAALAGTSVVIGLALLAASLRRLGPVGTNLGDDRPDLPRMVRGVRLAFLSVAAFAAAAGWLLAHPLPIVIALVIAGVDVVETSFLLLVVTLRQCRD